MSEWTKEPWFVLPNNFCVAGPFEPDYADDPDQETAGIAHCGMRLRSNDEAAANAARIVSCVNFCAGTASEYLDGADNLGRLLATAGAGINVELLAAAEAVASGLERDVRNYADGKLPSAERLSNRAAILRAAVARARSEAPPA